jgi:hypothetical protein
MKSILISLIIFVSTLSTSTIEAQLSIDETKRAYNFSEWPGKSGDVIALIDFTKESIAVLDTAEKKDNYENSFMVWDIEGGYVFCWQYRWFVISSYDVQIRVGMGGSCEEAREYMISRFMNRSSPALSVRDIPSVAGDISFDNGRYFIRNNLAFEISTFGDMIAKTPEIAKQIDGVILSKPTLHSGYKPVVSNIDVEKIPGSTRSLKITPHVYDPLGGNISIYTRRTNGVESIGNNNGVLTYNLYQPGSSEPILIFYSDSGFRTVVKLSVTGTDTDIFHSFRGE